MATRRDVELGLQVTTAGSEGIRRLKDEVDALARTGGEAAPAFQQLSNELDRLGEQATALEAFDAAARDIQALSLAQEAATLNANALGAELSELTARTQALREAEQQSLAALNASREALAQKRENLAILKANTDEAGRSEDSYKNAVREQTLAIIAQRASVRELIAAYKARKTETAQAVADEKKLESQFAATARQAREAGTALSSRDAALRESANALRALGVDTDRLTQAEIELVRSIGVVDAQLEELILTQQRAAEATRRQAEEDERLAFEAQANAAAYVNFWTQALNQREAAERETLATQQRAADAARQAGDAIQRAFGTVGVKSANDLQREIQEVRSALELLKSSGTLSGSELDRAFATGARRIKELERNVREATGQLTIMDRVSRTFQTTFGQTAAGFVAANAFQRLADLVLQAGRSFITANTQLEALRLGLQTVYKDTEIAEQQLALLRSTADRAGVSVGSISQAFLRLSASFQGANVPLEQTNALFQAVTQASGRLGLSGERTNRVLDALSQIAAKGVVSMEELRQQLGDSLPGALSVAANGLGITEQQLIKLVESGELLARDFIPAFTQGLAGLQGEVNTLSAGFERLRNFLTLAFQTIGDAGAVDILKGALFGLTAALGPLVIGFNTLLEIVTTSVRGLAALTGTLAGGGSVREALAAFGEEVDKSIERQGRLVEAYRQNIGVGEQLTTSTDGQVQKVAQLRVAYGEVEAQLTSNLAVAKAAVAATAQETQVTTQLAQALGTQAQSLQAAAESAQINAEAQQRVADAETTTLNVLKAKFDANKAIFEQEAAALAQTSATEAQREKAAQDRARELQELQRKIELQTEVAAKAQAQATASEIAAAAARIEAQSNADNSARVQELAKSYADAKTIFDSLSAGREAGLVTAKDLAAAEIQLGEATRLYRDSLRDTIDLIEANNAAKNADLAIITGGFNVRLAQLRSLEQTANATGNETLATYAKIEAKRVEVQILQATTKAQIIEAEGSISIARAKLEELRAAGELTKVKEIELNTSIKLAQAKILEAKARGEAVGILEAEIRALQNGTNLKNQNADSSGRAANNLTSEADARRRNAEAIGEENGALSEQSRLKKDAEGFTTGKDGQRLVQTSDLATRTGVLKFLQEAGVDEANARAITEEFSDSNGDITYFDNPGQIKYGGRGSTISQALLKAAESVTFDGRQVASPVGTPAQTAGAPATGVTAPAPAPSPASSVRTIRVEFEGRGTNINVASEADANNLERLIEQLTTAKGRVA